MAVVANTDIRAKAKEKGVYLWQIAAALGVADATFSRWLRVELPNKEKLRILDIIQTIAETQHDLEGDV